MRFILLLSLLGIFPVSHSAVKCRAAPKSLQNVQVCCPLPLPNWGAYNSECGRSGIQPSVSIKLYSTLDLFLNSMALFLQQCRLGCIFNATSALQGKVLSTKHVRPMLERAYANQKEIIDAYDANFASCATLVHSKYQELTQLSSQSDACDRHALFYSLCAYSKLMRRCPTNVWQANNKKCRDARAYMKKCAWPALKMFMKST
ncbi:uncharacterized protein LOC117570226 isoform X1 [Drosophila albomicans]|uniref:Uncharacterized protein LOC117570226 isoform X1 n=1 Tax=Drosophila albomicans TaxID=7291 RepID=A0A6P8YMD6_DROAB|nr:uncharacterized protein LOC117570226 isoform X1 [Drosophila albomicans]